VTPAVRAQLAEIASKHGVPIDVLHDEWSERAAIREYLGGMPRAKAEREAVGDACAVLGIAQQEDG
jgi:antitoxin component of RelBE/YafQ-DinJ toxin-antitoxin module